MFASPEMETSSKTFFFVSFNKLTKWFAFLRLYYRYFFKTILDYGSPMVVYQEVTDDSQILPLWENKVVGMVKKVE